MRRPVCLVCEDEMLIGIDVETYLEENDLEVSGPFARGTDALAWAATNRPDVALLDYTLQDGDCLPLISALQEKQVPIVIFSGWSPHGADMPSEITGLPWASKPADGNTLLKLLAEAAPQIVFLKYMNRTGATVRSDNSGRPKV